VSDFLCLPPPPSPSRRPWLRFCGAAPMREARCDESRSKSWRNRQEGGRGLECMGHGDDQSMRSISWERHSPPCLTRGATTKRSCSDHIAPPESAYEASVEGQCDYNPPSGARTAAGDDSRAEGDDHHRGVPLPLLFGVQQLQDGLTLVECGISDGSVVHPIYEWDRLEPLFSHPPCNAPHCPQERTALVLTGAHCTCSHESALHLFSQERTALVLTRAHCTCSHESALHLFSRECTALVLTRVHCTCSHDARFLATWTGSACPT
jgi:hypothetical protein